MMAVILKKWMMIGMVALLLLLASLAGISYYLWQTLHLNIKPPHNNHLYQIHAGDNLYTVSRDLERQGIIHSSKAVRLYARLTGLEGIQRGEYSLTSSLNHMQLLTLFGSGKAKSYPVTLLEGWTFQQALAHLHKQPKLVARLKGLSWLEQKNLLELELDYPEGWFFPDTYHYQKGDADVDVLLRAFKRLNKVLDKQWLKRAEGLPYETRYQALIMASIVEKETGADNEREQIAGVFVRRLKKGMRLQTDPTVIYGMGDKYQGNIRRKDLRAPTAYNTYTMHGLPPTPIALVGQRSIYAALHPDVGSSLYFVAKGDGSHKFSDSLGQHNAAVREYQVLKRRKAYRSSPAVEVNRSPND